jgi:putative peptidoglycan lipid II flippase
MKKLAGTTILMTGSSVISLGVNLLLQVYLAFRYGARAEMDAYVAATTLPTLLITVLVASLSVVFIPVFVEYETTHSPEQAWHAASSVLNLTLLVMTLIIVMGGLFSRPIMALTVPGLPPSTLRLSVNLLYWLWPTIILNALATLLMGLYQAEHRFTITAIAPVVGTLTLLGVTVLLSSSLGIQAVAFASLVSSLVQVLCLSPTLFEPGHYRLACDLRHPAVRSVLTLLTPLVLGSVIYRATPLVERFVASSLPAGSLAHLSYGNRIALVLNTVFVSGIATTLFPSMAQEAAARDFPKLRQTVARGQRMLMLFLFPAIALLWALRVPFLAVFLQRGQFMPQDTQAVAAILPWYLLAVVGGALGTLVGRVYYVLKDTRTPVILGLVEVAAYVLYLPWLARLYGAPGVALANAVYFSAALLVGALVIFYKLGAVGGSNLLRASARLALVSGMAGMVAYGFGRWFGGKTILALVGGGLVGGGVYFAVLYIFRMRELVWLGTALEASRFGRSLRWLLKPLLKNAEAKYG